MKDLREDVQKWFITGIYAVDIHEVSEEMLQYQRDAGSRSHNKYNSFSYYLLRSHW